MVADDSRLGLALGGGSARAFAHIGALKVLEARSLRPVVISGTSFGAGIAALYALGTHAVALEHLARSQNTLELWAQLFDFGWHKGGAIHGKRLMYWLDRKFFFGATFKDTEIPLVISCTDISTGELLLLREGSIAHAVVASCSLPGIFAPVAWQDKWLMDGGFVATVPFAALNHQPLNLRLGLHAGINAERSRLVGWIRRWQNSYPGQSLRRTLLNMPGPALWQRSCKASAHVLASYGQRVLAPSEHHLIHMNPPISWWDFHRSPEAIQAGEQAMCHMLDNLQKPVLP